METKQKLIIIFLSLLLILTFIFINRVIFIFLLLACLIFISLWPSSSSETKHKIDKKEIKILDNLITSNKEILDSKLDLIINMWNLDRRTNLIESFLCIDSPEYISKEIISPKERNCFDKIDCQQGQYQLSLGFNKDIYQSDCSAKINLKLITNKKSFYGFFYINVSNISQNLNEMHLEINVGNNNWVTLFPKLQPKVSYVTTQIPVFFNNVNIIEIRLREFKQLIFSKKIGQINLSEPNLYDVRDSQILYGNIINSNFILNLNENMIKNENNIPLWITQSDVAVHLIPTSNLDAVYDLNKNIIEDAFLPNYIRTNSEETFENNSQQLYTTKINIYELFLEAINQGEQQIKIPIRKPNKKCSFGFKTCSTGFENYNQNQKWFLIYSKNHPFNLREFDLDLLSSNIAFQNNNYASIYETNYTGNKKVYSLSTTEYVL